MSPAERLAELLDVEPRPTVEIVVSGERFTARVRTAEAFANGPVELLLGSVSASASATVELLPPMPSEILRRLYLETYGVDLPTPEEVTRLRAAETRLHRLLEEPAPAEADMRPSSGGRAAL